MQGDYQIPYQCWIFRPGAVVVTAEVCRIDIDDLLGTVLFRPRTVDARM